MRRLILLGTAVVLLVLTAVIVYVVGTPRSAAPEGSLVIYGTSGEEILRPVLAAYRVRRPGVRIRYVSLGGPVIFRQTLADLAAHRHGADLLLSTAMDLQVKLVNDGYAVRHRSAAAMALPPWARWRDEAFGVAFEPAAMVFNRRLMAGRPIPQSRAELLAAINADPDFWRGRVGAYDIRAAGVGYLLTAEESRQASDFGALMKSFGTADVRLERGGGLLLQALERDELAVGYNVLGSNARRRIREGVSLIVVYPRDFTLAVVRTALIPRSAAHPGEAHAFLDFLLSDEGQRILAGQAGFDPIRGATRLAGNGPDRIGVFRPIQLGPQLLVYLDPHKRRRLLANWEALVGHGRD